MPAPATGPGWLARVLSGRAGVIAALVVVGSLWGSSFPLIRIAAPAFGAVGATHARLVVGAAVLAALSVTSRGAWRAVGGRIGAFLLLGGLNAAAPLTLVATAIVGLNSSMAAILNATTPIFTVAVAAVWLKQAVTVRRLLGVVVGVIGVAVVVGGAPIALDTRSLVAIAASLLAALLYALGGTYARRAFATTGLLPLALGQQLAAATLLIPVTLAAPPPGPITGAALAAIIVVGLGATAGAYLLYFWVIRQAGPVAGSTVTLLVPLTGTTIGVVWLHEPLTPGVIIGLIIILSGVGLLTPRPNSA